MSDYQPVSCEIHSEFELFIMHNTQLEIHWQDENRNEIVMQVMPQDIQTHNKEEFLQANNTDGEQLSIRLDRILSYQAVKRS